jgi:hypothetical protein
MSRGSRNDVALNDVGARANCQLLPIRSFGISLPLT